MKPCTGLPATAAFRLATSSAIAACPVYFIGPLQIVVTPPESGRTKPGVAKPGRTGPPDPVNQRPETYVPGKSARSRSAVPPRFGGRGFFGTSSKPETRSRR